LAEEYDDKTKKIFDTLTDYDNYGFRTRETFSSWKNGKITAGFDLDYFGGKVIKVSKQKTFKRDRETSHISAPYVTLSHQFGKKTG